MSVGNYRVYVDTNILINDYFYRTLSKPASKPASDALVFLRSTPRVNLYIASFSIIQVVSTLSKAKISDEAIRQEIKRMIEKYEIGTFMESDITNGLNIAGKDVEDVFQYAMSQKLKCGYILTDNIKDFNGFKDVLIVSSKSVRKVV